MKCKILHEARGHMRVHLVCGRMTLKEADVLEYYLRAVDGVKEVKVYGLRMHGRSCFRGRIHRSLIAGLSRV